jgi:hypothetical protein
MVVDESPVHRSHGRGGVVKPALTAVLLVIASSCAAIFNEDTVVDANLVLVRANPLQNIGATRGIDVVVVDGRLFN